MQFAATQACVSRSGWQVAGSPEARARERLWVPPQLQQDEQPVQGVHSVNTQHSVNGPRPTEHNPDSGEGHIWKGRCGTQA